MVRGIPVLSKMADARRTMQCNLDYVIFILARIAHFGSLSNGSEINPLLSRAEDKGCCCDISYEVIQCDKNTLYILHTVC